MPSGSCPLAWHMVLSFVAAMLINSALPLVLLVALRCGHSIDLKPASCVHKSRAVGATGMIPSWKQICSVLEKSCEPEPAFVFLYVVLLATEKAFQVPSVQLNGYRFLHCILRCAPGPPGDWLLAFCLPRCGLHSKRSPNCILNSSRLLGQTHFPCVLCETPRLSTSRVTVPKYIDAAIVCCSQAGSWSLCRWGYCDKPWSGCPDARGS